MKYLLALTLALGFTLSSSAQMASVSAPIRLLPAGSEPMYNPALNADGTAVEVFDADYSNARIVSIAQRSVQDADISTQEAMMANFPATVDNVSVSTSGSELTITVNDVSRTCSPIESYAGYCWASVSPDASKVMFFAAGKGIVVCDLQGNILSRPGNYEAPVWYGNDHILAQNATDDGHQYSSSQIVLLSADGRQMQELTAPESMAMNPSGAIDNSTVVFTTVDGILYKMNVYLR